MRINLKKNTQPTFGEDLKYCGEQDDCRVTSKDCIQYNNDLQ